MSSSGTLNFVTRYLADNDYFTVYHGTTAENKAEILKTGLLKEYTSDINKSYMKKDYASVLNKVDHDKLGGLTYTTPSLHTAAFYSVKRTIQEKKLNLDPFNENLINKAMSTMDGIIEFRLPKSFLKYKVYNPLYDKMIKSSKEFNNGIESPLEDRVRYAEQIFGSDIVFNADIPISYIVG